MDTKQKLEKLDSLSQGFRNTYLSYEAITRQLNEWAENFPDLIQIESIGTSIENRNIWVATVGKEPSRERPSVWIDGNMHASELCGSSVALAICEDILRLHLGEKTTLGESVKKQLLDVRFFITPRICPDGAEAVLTNGRYVRSNPRDRRVNQSHARWVAEDMNQDGLALLMRQIDPAGEFVASKEIPDLMLPRSIEDEGPFYKLYPEGYIEAWDGSSVPDPYFLSDNDTDLNRNFPWSWVPEPEQVGAGSYPLSEPESRAVVEFVSKHPEIFAWLNLHTFGGVYIRPLGFASDKKMHPDDLALFRQIEQWGEEFGKYPMVSGFEEFTYEPEKPLHGDMADFAYHQRGCIAFVCELWDLFHQVGIKRKKPFVDTYTHMGKEDLIKLAKWDQKENRSRIIRPWKSFTHPQLGEVELGGVDTRVGLINPPYEKLPEICTQQSEMFLRVASLGPQIQISHQNVRSLGENLYEVETTIANHGYLPSYILSSARSLSWNEPLTVEASTEGECSLSSSQEARREIGHLDGWGRGRFHGTMALFYQRSRGSVSQKTLRWVVKGKGVLRLRIGSCRVGFFETGIEVA